MDTMEECSLRERLVVLLLQSVKFADTSNVVVAAEDLLRFIKQPVEISTTELTKKG